ncbi:MAG: hypothetical protein KAR45_08330 [Desulfobacteraceae bacterium]|nr:hypothetical protein [Desulfobacteraceae bacterium]
MEFEPNTELPKNLLKYLGSGKDALSAKKVPFLWQEALSLAQVIVFKQELKKDDFFSLFSPYAKKSRAVRRLLQDCHSVMLMIATLGTQLEGQAKKYRIEKQLFSGYILDRMGSYLVESTMRNLDRTINCECDDRQQTCTIRYSPGYQDFSLKCQNMFVHLVRQELPFLKIKPNFQLMPEKTITAIKGIKNNNN